MSFPSPPPDINPDTWASGAAFLQAKFPDLDNSFLWRFLVANNGSGAEAANQLTKTNNWRKENKVEQVLKTFPPYSRADYLKQTYPHFFHGKDDAGHQVYIDCVGRANALSKRFTDSEIIEYHIYFQEYLWNIAAPEHNAQSIVIIDLSGMSLFSVPWSVIQKQFAIDTNYYPERLYKLMIVNAPSVFNFVWKTIEPLLDQRTRDKIKFLGSKYRDELPRYINMSCVPPEYGGTSPYKLGQHPQEIQYLEAIRAVAVNPTTLEVPQIEKSLEASPKSSLSSRSSDSPPLTQRSGSGIRDVEVEVEQAMIPETYESPVENNSAGVPESSSSSSDVTPPPPQTENRSLPVPPLLSLPNSVTAEISEPATLQPLTFAVPPIPRTASKHSIKHRLSSFLKKQVTPRAATTAITISIPHTVEVMEGAQGVVYYRITLESDVVLDYGTVL
eukprot:c2483_g1_i1.p1 GENE.c2483_g1_i1~~c2483_g1_i1.p1  ORF type:complete len:444 (+),score=96.22 c2483_g1_i1:52-1383(+)